MIQEDWITHHPAIPLVVSAAVRFPSMLPYDKQLVKDAVQDFKNQHFPDLPPLSTDPSSEESDLFTLEIRNSISSKVKLSLPWLESLLTTIEQEEAKRCSTCLDLQRAIRAIRLDCEDHTILATNRSLRRQKVDEFELHRTSPDTCCLDFGEDPMETAFSTTSLGAAIERLLSFNRGRLMVIPCLF